VTPWSAEWKQGELNRLYAQWKDCERCSLHIPRQFVVFGEGNPDADILWVSGAPGEKEDTCGRPFVGKAGGLLNELFEVIGIDRSDLYITSIVACRPPKNREPMKTEKDACLKRLHELIYIVDPLIIVACGKLAFNTLVKGRSWSVEKERGKLFSSPHPLIKTTGEPNGAEIPGRFFPQKGADKKTFTLDYDVVPVYDPAHVLKNDNFDDEKGTFLPGGLAHRTLDDLKALKDRIENIKQEHETTRLAIERGL
jgi:DNA polymerase